MQREFWPSARPFPLHNEHSSAWAGILNPGFCRDAELSGALTVKGAPELGR